MLLFAVAPAASLAALLAPTGVPDRIGQHVHGLDGQVRVIAFDDELAGARALLRGLVPDHYVETRSRVQCRREGIVEELPVMALALEPDAGHVQRAVTGVAD